MAETLSTEPAAGPYSLIGLNHITLPTRDAKEARRFWVTLFDAQVTVDNATFVELDVGDCSLGFSENGTPLEPRSVDSPHIALSVTEENLLPLKAWMEAHGVPTQPLWTRGKAAHMYFRDPSGNLFELICTGYSGLDRLPRPPSSGGDLVFDLEALNYEWRD